MRLLCKDEDLFKQPDPPSPEMSPPLSPDVEAMRLLIVEPPVRYHPVKIEPYAENYWPHYGMGFNYNEWSPIAVATFLETIISSRQPTLIEIINQQIKGSELYSCFLDPESSELFRRKVGYSQGIAMKIRMALGNIHNYYYNLL